LVVERALAHLPADASGRAADLGTGSGAIALAIASERPALPVVATDISTEALDIATRNVARLQLANVTLLNGSWFAPLANQRFNVITSNPPYVGEDDPDLSADVRRHEPGIALISGRSGLEAIGLIISTAPQHLVAGGWLILEHGWKQAAAVRELLVRAGFARVRSHADLAGLDRVTEGQLAGYPIASILICQRSHHHARIQNLQRYVHRPAVRKAGANHDGEFPQIR